MLDSVDSSLKSADERKPLSRAVVSSSLCLRLTCISEKTAQDIFCNLSPAKRIFEGETPSQLTQAEMASVHYNRYARRIFIQKKFLIRI